MPPQTKAELTAERFEITLGPSRYLRALNLLSCGVALCGIWLTALPNELAVALSLLLVAVFILSALHSGSRWRANKTVRRLVCCTNGEWQLYTNNGTDHSARLLSCYLQPYLVILNFIAVERTADRGQSRGLFSWLNAPLRTRSVLILPDSADTDALRQLRWRLRQRRDAAI